MVDKYEYRYLEAQHLKVLYVITRSDVMGGASVHLLDLVSGLKQRGYETEVLAGGEGVLQTIAQARGIEVRSLRYLVRNISPVSDFMAFFELKRHIKQINPDLVHLHSSKAGLIGRIVCAYLRVPCVFTAHGWAFTEGVSENSRKIYKTLERLVASLSRRIIAVSEYDRQLALKNGVGSAELIVTVRNGVPDKNQGYLRDTGQESVRLIMVARFEAPKDQKRLIAILATLKHLKWTLELVGDGPELLSAQILSNSLGLQDRVIFSGACSDVPARLSKADAFILLSKWEGLPLTILEAMSLNLPVIASDVGGVNETIDTESGILVTDDYSISKALTHIITEPELRLSMGNAARQRYEQFFTVGRMLDDTQAIYEEAVR